MIFLKIFHYSLTPMEQRLYSKENGNRTFPWKKHLPMIPAGCPAGIIVTNFQAVVDLLVDSNLHE